jgi:hypothetical protein
VRVAVGLAALVLVSGCEQPMEDLPDAARLRRDAAIDALSLDAAYDAGPPPACPPMRPFGPDVGDVLGTFTVYDCAGTPFEIESLCETDVVWIWEFAEWCASCRYFADGNLDAVYSRYETAYGDRFAAVPIITADSELNLPNEEICRELRQHRQHEQGQQRRRERRRRSPPWPAAAAPRRRCRVERHRHEPQARDQRGHQHRPQPLQGRVAHGLAERHARRVLQRESRRMVDTSTMSPSTATPAQRDEADRPPRRERHPAQPQRRDAADRREGHAVNTRSASSTRP